MTREWAPSPVGVELLTLGDCHRMKIAGVWCASMFHAQTELVLNIHVVVTHLRRVKQFMFTNNVDH